MANCLKKIDRVEQKTNSYRQFLFLAALQVHTPKRSNLIIRKHQFVSSNWISLSRLPTFFPSSSGSGSLEATPSIHMSCQLSLSAGQRKGWS